MVVDPLLMRRWGPAFSRALSGSKASPLSAPLLAGALLGLNVAVTLLATYRASIAPTIAVSVLLHLYALAVIAPPPAVFRRLALGAANQAFTLSTTLGLVDTARAAPLAYRLFLLAAMSELTMRHLPNPAPSRQRNGLSGLAILLALLGLGVDVYYVGRAPHVGPVLPSALAAAAVTLWMLNCVLLEQSPTAVVFNAAVLLTPTLCAAEVGEATLWFTLRGKATYAPGLLFLTLGADLFSLPLPRLLSTPLEALSREPAQRALHALTVGLASAAIAVHSPGAFVALAAVAGGLAYTGQLQPLLSRLAATPPPPQPENGKAKTK